MAAKFSQGLRNFMLTGGSFKAALDNSELRVYSGTVPDTADAAIGGASLLLCTYKAGANGLAFATAATNGVLPKDPSQMWSGEVLANGTPTFFRVVTSTDDDTNSDAFFRIQGSCGMGGADLNLSSPTFTLGETEVINNFYIALPTV